MEQVPADDAYAPAVLLDEPEREVLLEDDEALLHPLLQLLVEHLDEDVTCDVRGIDGARRAGRAEGRWSSLPSAFREKTQPQPSSW